MTLCHYIMSLHYVITFYSLANQEKNGLYSAAVSGAPFCSYQDSSLQQDHCNEKDDPLFSNTLV